MKRIISALLAALMLLSLLPAAVAAEDAGPATITVQSGVYYDGEDALDPVTLGTEEQTVWQDDVLLNETGASGVTFVYKVDGVDSPIIPGKWDFDLCYYLNGAAGDPTHLGDSKNWFYNNVWGGSTLSNIVYFEDSGVYYTYVNRRLTAAPDYPAFYSVSSFTLFKSGNTVQNENANATFRMLAVIEHNMNPTVNYYLGEEFIGSASIKYTEGPDKNDWGSGGAGKYWAHGKVATPSDLAEENGITLPTKEENEDYRYELVWKDADGNIVEGVYKSQDLYADFVEIDNTVSYVEFLGVDGRPIVSYEGTKGEHAAFDGVTPEKETDDNYVYTFKCWSVNGEEVDLDTYVLGENEETFVPVFDADLRQRVVLTVSEQSLSVGDEFTLTVGLNRSDITFAGDKEPMTDGTITLNYPKSYDIEGGVDGVLEIPFDGVAEDGTVATLTLTAPKGLYGPVIFSATGVAESDSAETELLEGRASTFVGGGAEGLFLPTEDAEWVSLPTDETGLSATAIWEGDVNFTGAGGVTLVIRAKGVESPIEAGMMRFDHSHVGNDNNNNMIWEWAYSNDWTKTDDGTDVALRLAIPADGYYYIYLSRKILGMTHDGSNLIDKMSSFIVFGKGNKALATGQTPTNTNENAQVQVLAIAADNLWPTVTFRDAEGGVLYTAQHKYTELTNAEKLMDDKPVSNHYQKGTLLSASAIFEAAGVAAPTKESDIPEVEYVFDGWQDEDGNTVEAVYMDCDLYPTFKTVDKRTQYNVVFKNYDGTVLYETVVPEGVVPEYNDKLGTPRKPSTDTNSYKFLGWDRDITATPTTPEADGATAVEPIVYTAQYEETVRTYNVIYYDERGKNVLFEDLHLSYGSASSCDLIPTKEADVKYNYTFDKWVTLDGEEVDLSRVTCDLDLKPTFTVALNKYTVTFMNGETEIGKSTVEYGSVAEAPAATKESVGYYRFDFKEWVDGEGNPAKIDNVKGDMTVYATFLQVFEPPFGDIDVSSWYAPAVEYVIVNGIMNGMGAGFQPGTNMSRAMVVTVLYRYTDAPVAGEKEVSFTDVPDGEWYSEAIAWAASNEIVNGRGNGVFDPNGNVTRQEFAAILYRYADKINDEYMGFGKSTVASFADKGDIDSWAINPVKWAFATATDMDTTAPGVIYYEKTQYINGKGMKDGKPLMAPKANATRAEVATMLYRYMTGLRLTKDEAGA